METQKWRKWVFATGFGVILYRAALVRRHGFSLFEKGVDKSKKLGRIVWGSE